MEAHQSSFPGAPTTMLIRSDPHNSTAKTYKRPEGAGDAALYYESPMWLALASGCESHRDQRTPVIDMTRIHGPGSRGMERENPTDDLPSIMATIDSTTEILHITGDVPSNDQWEALGKHFDNVRFLKVAAGWDESWIDDKFPLNWPLELLVVADACGERITTPAIMQGRIKHLVLLLTAGLRFDGPVTKDLMKDAEQHPQANGIKVQSVPAEWDKWFHRMGGISLSPQVPQGSPPSAMKHLSIIGNDALEVLAGIGMAKFYLLASLDSLTLYSASENDMLHLPANSCLAVLPRLTNLTTLKLTLGSPMYACLVGEGGNQHFLPTFFPPNIQTLHFRGPVSMVPRLDQFAAAFAYERFLPQLKRISLVLDLQDESSESPSPSPEVLTAAHAACRKVLDAAAKRGVVVDEFRDPWAEAHPRLFWQVDDRWAVLEENWNLGS
jgi:hypothetical protein